MSDHPPENLAQSPHGEPRSPIASLSEVSNRPPVPVDARGPVPVPGQDSQHASPPPHGQDAQAPADEATYIARDSYAGLNEILGVPPVQNTGDADLYQAASLERARLEEQQYRRESKLQNLKPLTHKPQTISRLTTDLFTVSYLILFSIFGTLARLGLQAITVYQGAPLITGVTWANFAGSFFMGYLTEDAMLFKNVCDTPAAEPKADERSSRRESFDAGAAKKAHNAAKKAIPLYIGLATGFCGSFTSYSSFIRDVYLALSNQLPTPINHLDSAGNSVSTTSHRNGGYSFEALVAVIIVTVCICLSALVAGGHFAIAIGPYAPRLRPGLPHIILDRLAVFLAFGCWLGSIFLAIFPPDRHSSGPEIWRGRACYAIVFAPLGCLSRFYASLWLNSKVSSFPLGTFAVNIFGTAILGMCWDLQHVPLGGVVGCQVLQGIMDGYCGCLTTVSTWVSELNSLKRHNAYRYGLASIAVALAFLVIIMGSMQWTRGFSSKACVT